MILEDNIPDSPFCFSLEFRLQAESFLLPDSA
jgi:hypothetical protein